MAGSHGRQFRDITQRYCAGIDDNVIVERKRVGDHDEFICLSRACGRGECEHFGNVGASPGDGAGAIGDQVTE